MVAGCRALGQSTRDPGIATTCRNSLAPPDDVLREIRGAPAGTSLSVFTALLIFLCALIGWLHALANLT
jgi:hypothetical protein